jgi:hypothetical protein
MLSNVCAGINIVLSTSTNMHLSLALGASSAVGLMFCSPCPTIHLECSILPDIYKIFTFTHHDLTNFSIWIGSSNLLTGHVYLSMTLENWEFPSVNSMVESFKSTTLHAALCFIHQTWLHACPLMDRQMLPHHIDPQSSSDVLQQPPNSVESNCI